MNRPYGVCVSPWDYAKFCGRNAQAPLRCRERPLCRSAEWDKIFTGRRVVAPYGVVRCFSRVGTDVSSVRGRTQFAPTGIAHRRGIMQNFAGVTRKHPYGVGNDLCVVP